MSQRALRGKTITGIELLQPKCLNVTPRKLKGALTGARFEDVTYHGKWIFARTTRGYLLLNLGMGGDMLLCDRQSLPEKYQAVFDFDDGRSLSFRFWWFGYIHYAADDKLDRHKMTAKLGPNAVDVTKEEFRAMLGAKIPPELPEPRVRQVARMAALANTVIIALVMAVPPYRPRGNPTAATR